MRQLLLLLLLANGVFFLWEKYVRPGMDAMPMEADGAPKLDNIVLVRELPPAPQVMARQPLATPREAGSKTASSRTPALTGELDLPLLSPLHPQPPASAKAETEWTQPPTSAATKTLEVVEGAPPVEAAKAKQKTGAALETPVAAVPAQIKKPAPAPVEAPAKPVAVMPPQPPVAVSPKAEVKQPPKIAVVPRPEAAEAAPAVEAAKPKSKPGAAPVQPKKPEVAPVEAPAKPAVTPPQAPVAAAPKAEVKAPPKTAAAPKPEAASAAPAVEAAKPKPATVAGQAYAAAPQADVTQPAKAAATPKPETAGTAQALAPAQPITAEPRQAAATPSKSEPPATAQCRRIGPLTSEADAQALRQHLAAGAETVGVERKSGKAEIGYWVMYPPAATVEAARANKRLLADKGIADTMILKDGEHALGVSLGYFKDRARAEKLLGEAQAKGMEVVVKPRTNPREEYWLKLQPKSSAAVASQWRAWQAEHPDSPARENACP